jgi:hypothetical protein
LSRRLRGRILTGANRIKGMEILQHHDVVIGETIVGANDLEERHRTPRCQQGATPNDAPLGTQSLEVARTELDASRERNGATRYMPHGTHMAARRRYR